LISTDPLGVPTIWAVAVLAYSVFTFSSFNLYYFFYSTLANLSSFYLDTLANKSSYIAFCSGVIFNNLSLAFKFLSSTIFYASFLKLSYFVFAYCLIEEDLFLFTGSSWGG